MAASIDVGNRLCFFVMMMLSAFIVIKIIEDWEQRRQFGVLFGVVNAFFSVLAFAGLIITIRQQHIDLKYQRQAINANQSRMQQLKKEIDLGLWDTYLFWDWEAYQSVRNQNNMAVVFANVIQNNLAQQCTTQINNNDRVELNAQQTSGNH